MAGSKSAFAFHERPGVGSTNDRVAHDAKASPLPSTIKPSVFAGAGARGREESTAAKEPERTGVGARHGLRSSYCRSG